MQTKILKWSGLEMTSSSVAQKTNSLESPSENYQELLSEDYPPDPEVYQFLESRIDRLLPHLLDAPHAAKRIFGENTKMSWQIFDAGDPALSQLVLVIRSDHTPDEIVRLQDCFFEEWFVPRIDEIWPDIIYTEEVL
jgi:hypothetical protein